MVAEAEAAAAAAEILFQQTVALPYHPLCVPPPEIDSPSPAALLLLSKPPPPPAGAPPPPSSSSAVRPSSLLDHPSVSFDLSRSESAFSCSTSNPTANFLDSSRVTEFLPIIRSGSCTDIGSCKGNEDEHVCVDDLHRRLGPICRWPVPSSFYAVFDGHGGSDASTYLKNNALKFFFQEDFLPRNADIDESFLMELENFHSRAFLLADQALADQALAAKDSVRSCCGTTAITALLYGRHLLIANAGDSRAVLCRKGKALQLSQDHRATCVVERERVEDLGGFFDEAGYLNGHLAVTRALGDWYMKSPHGSKSPLTAEPEMHQILLTEDDEFLIIACDGIWDVMSNEDAVRVVRHELRVRGDPEVCARELVARAQLRDIGDNLTAIVVCFTSPYGRDPMSRSGRFRRCILSEEARMKLRSLLDCD